MDEQKYDFNIMSILNESQKQNNHQKSLPQTPKSFSKNKLTQRYDVDNSLNSQSSDHPTQPAPPSVRVMDIMISPKSPSTKRRGSKSNRSNRISGNELNVFEGNNFTNPSIEHQKSTKRRSSSISSFSSSIPKDDYRNPIIQENEENGKEINNPTHNRRNRRSTMSYDQNSSYLTLQTDDDKENEKLELNQALNKSRGTWSGWMRGGQLLKPKVLKEMDFALESNKVKQSSTKQQEIKSNRSSNRSTTTPLNNKQRSPKHQRTRASTSHTWMIKDEVEEKKKSIGNQSKKWNSSQFKTPQSEGKATFGRQKKRASISAILAPAFEQQTKRVNLTNELEDEGNSSPFELPKYDVKKPQSESLENKKTPIPKRDLTTIFEKHLKSNPFTPSMSETKANITVNNCLQEPFGSQPILQATLAGLGIFATPPNGMKEQNLVFHSNRNMTPSRNHLSPMASLAMNVTPQSAKGEKALPKIVITPPVPIRQPKRSFEENRDEKTEGKLNDASFQTKMEIDPREMHQSMLLSSAPTNSNENSEQSENATNKDDESTLLPLEDEIPSFEVQEKRSHDDKIGLDRIKLVIDAYLSDFFVERPSDHVKRLLPGLSELLISHLDPESVYELHSWGRNQPIPSLCAFCTVQEGNEVIVLHPRWVRWKLQCTLDIVLDHIITGVIALIADDRAPYSTPPVMASLIESLHEGLMNPNEIQLGRGRFDVNDLKSGQENALGTWVQMCAMAVGLGGGQIKENATIAEMTQMRSLKPEEKVAWRVCLDGIQPSQRLVELLLRHISLILERGKATRERNNLLVVPPMQRGSRKRWLAANAEHQARRASHDENFAKLTSGQISESEYRSTERRMAATGHPKDTFAALNLVRFVGELYKVSIISETDLQDWLNRLLFDTVFPGVPSLYELEAGCALLLTVGKAIEVESGKRMGSSSPESVQSPSFLRMDVTSSPTKPILTNNLIKNQNVLQEKHLEPWSIIIQCIVRLQEIQQIEEVHEDGKLWCREMVAMHQRGWQRAGPSKTQMNTISSAAQAARRARRGGMGMHNNSTNNRGRQQEQQSQQPRPGYKKGENVKNDVGEKGKVTAIIHNTKIVTSTSSAAPTDIAFNQENWSESETEMKESQQECERSSSTVTVHDYNFDIQA